MKTKSKVWPWGDWRFYILKAEARFVCPTATLKSIREFGAARPQKRYGLCIFRMLVSRIRLWRATMAYPTSNKARQLLLLRVASPIRLHVLASVIVTSTSSPRS